MDIYLATCIPFSVVAVVIETRLRSVSVEPSAVALRRSQIKLKISCECVTSSVKAWRCIYRAESKVGLARYVRIVRADIVKALASYACHINVGFFCILPLVLFLHALES